MKKIALGCALTLIIVLMGKAVLCAEIRGVSRVYNEPASFMQDCVSMMLTMCKGSYIKPANKMTAQNIKYQNFNFTITAIVKPLGKNKSKVEMYCIGKILSGAGKGQTHIIGEASGDAFDGFFTAIESIIKVKKQQQQ